MDNGDRPRAQLRLLPWPVAMLCAGMLIDAAATVWDLRHLRESFNYGDSQNGAVAYLMEGGFAWFRLVSTAVLVPLLWVGARRAHRSGSRAAGVIGPLSVPLALCGGLLTGSNDGSEPDHLGIVHDARTPAWIHVADVAGPAAILLGAAGALVVVLRAFVTWSRPGDFK